MTAALVLPHLPRGRPSNSALESYDAELQRFCGLIREINSRLDFKVSSRGWCYLLEDHGLDKGQFDDAQKLIAECRRRRLLPMDIVAEDDARAFENVERELDESDAGEFAASILATVEQWHEDYTPISFWDDKDIFLAMVVEKIDLRTLFSPICAEFRIPIANARGWSDLNLRWRILEMMREHVAAGRRFVLLYCGDHDPAGLNISKGLRKNLSELLTHSEWLELMDHLTVDRFGLNADFITKHRLTWINNLKTGSGGDLADQHHKDHKSDYVQNYLRAYGARKVEANALVVRPDAGRKLCRNTILKYLPADAPDNYRETLETYREEARREIARQFRTAYGRRGGHEQHRARQGHESPRGRSARHLRHRAVAA